MRSVNAVISLCEDRSTPRIGSGGPAGTADHVERGAMVRKTTGARRVALMANISVRLREERDLGGYWLVRPSKLFK